MCEIFSYFNTSNTNYVSDISRTTVTISIHQKEQLQYLQNIHEHSFLNTTSIINVHNNETRKDENNLYDKFPATSVEEFSMLDDEIKRLRSSKINAYNVLMNFKFIV